MKTINDKNDITKKIGVHMDYMYTVVIILYMPQKFWLYIVLEMCIHVPCCILICIRTDSDRARLFY